MFCQMIYIKNYKNKSTILETCVLNYDYTMEYIDNNIMDIFHNNFGPLISSRYNRRMSLTFFDKDERTKYFIYYCKPKYLQRFVACSELDNTTKDDTRIYVDGYCVNIVNGLECTRYDIVKPEKFYYGDYVEYFYDGHFYKGVIANKEPVFEYSHQKTRYEEVSHIHDNHYLIEDILEENDYCYRQFFQVPISITFNDCDLYDIIHGSDIKLIERGKYIKYLEKREEENKM